MKYFKGILITATVSVISFFSSCNFLNVDDYFVDTFNYDSIFVKKLNVERYLWNIPTLLPDQGAIFGGNSTPGILASDEAFCQWRTFEFPGMQFALGNITADNLSNFGSTWPSMYKVVRKTNTILANLYKCQDLTTQDKGEILGFTYFLRAYAYYLILKDFGPMVILDDKILETNENPDYYNMYRATYDESVEYICTELEKAAKLMPMSREIMLAQFGRPSRDAAYGLLSRIRLTHASDAFNGGASARRYFGTWKRTFDGAYYVAQTPDNKRWALAAFAAEQLIDKSYTLHTVKKDVYTPDLQPGVPTANFPDGAGDIDPYKSYKDMFSGESVPQKNPEIIWGRYSSGVQSYTKHSFPTGNMNGWGGMAVPQKIIDAFYMVNGTEYANAGVDEQSKTSASKSFSGYQQQPNISKMYDNREMRFYANIGYSGRMWPCGSTTDNTKKNIVVTYFLDGNSGKAKAGNNIDDYTITGYVTTKFIHDDDAWAGAAGVVLGKSFPIIRYAEILLNYVEALNNIEGTETFTDGDGEVHTYTRDDAKIVKYFNQIRYRVGLPGIKHGLSKDEITKLIIRERMLEFFDENMRYYDVRRWGIYEEVDSEPIMGMNTEVKENEGYYDRVLVNHIYARTRKSDKKMVLLPLSRTELRKVPLLDQNPGWE